MIFIQNMKYDLFNVFKSYKCKWINLDEMQYTIKRLEDQEKKQGRGE